MKKTIEEVRDYLLENRLDGSGKLDLTGLDFSEFDGIVDISYMKVKGYLCQAGQEVRGDLYQGTQKVEGNLWQHHQEVKGTIFQDEIINYTKKELEEKIGHKFKIVNEIKKGGI